MLKNSATHVQPTTKFTVTNWVKNVYNLLKRSALKSVKSYTGWYKQATQLLTMWVKTNKNTQTINTFPPTKYTAFLHILPPIPSYLYTLSTAPIIKKMK